MINKLVYICLSLMLIGVSDLSAQKNKSVKNNPKTTVEKNYLDSISFDGMAFRSIGPALTSGRISDIAVHPDNPYEYIVASSSGGVWKTSNAGTTFTPVFDDKGSYSIGCVQYDPFDPKVVWVGTGENNNQRSVAYGDGIYKSSDGEKTGGA